MENMGPINAWRQYKERYLLQGVVCCSCCKKYYPKIYLCQCGSMQFEVYNFNGIGTLVSFTAVHNPSTEFKKMSVYCIGLIKLDDGPVITAQLTDVKIESLKIGMRMRSVFRRFYSQGDSGIIEYGVKFVPNVFVPNEHVCVK